MGYFEKQKLGKWGEEKAKQFLLNHQVIIVSENFRTHHGEIDLIGWDSDCLVFFEVKTRQSTNFGSPDQAVEEIKLTKIIETALSFMVGKFSEEPLWRIDIISIFRDPKTENYQIDWIKNAQA